MKILGKIKVGLAVLSVASLVLVSFSCSKKEKSASKKSIDDELSAWSKEVTETTSEVSEPAKEEKKEAAETAKAEEPKKSNDEATKMLKAYEDLVVSMENAVKKKNLTSLMDLSNKALAAADKLDKVKGDLTEAELVQLTKLTARYAETAAKMTSDALDTGKKALDTSKKALDTLKGFGF